MIDSRLTRRRFLAATGAGLAAACGVSRPTPAPLFGQWNRLHPAGYSGDVFVRHSNRFEGPGPNLWDKEAVQLESDRLRLSAVHSEYGWHCAEVAFELSGPSVVSFDVESPLHRLPEPLIFGAFFYRDDQREMDIEFGRFGTREPRLHHTVVGRTGRSWALEPHERSSHEMHWGPDGLALHSTWLDASRVTAVAPTPRFEGHRLHFNLWAQPRMGSLRARFEVDIANLMITPSSQRVTGVPMWNNPAHRTGTSGCSADEATLS